MNRFVEWYRENQNEITWFIIGFLVMGGLNDFSKGDLIGAGIAWGLAFVNYKLNKL